MKKLMSIIVIVSMFIILGCQKPLVKVDPATITQVFISHQNGGVGITDESHITALITAMQNAKKDSTLYDTPKDLTIELQQGTTSLVRISAGGPIFNIGNQQYYSEEFETILRKFLTRNK